MLILRILITICLFHRPLSVSGSSIEHRWVSWDGTGDSLEDLPVLHTAFVQTGEELHYFSESKRYDADIFVGHRSHDSDPGQSHYKDRVFNVRKMAGEDSLPLEFDPPFLFFGESAVGVPLRRRVYLRSKLNTLVMLDTVIGETVNFHAGFFDVMELEPLGSTSFEIAFLPREEGKITATLGIHTSIGQFLYEISGYASSNPYRITPFVGHRIPMNGTMVKEITLHNPHPQTFRIKELVSSGGHVHAELAYDIDPAVAGEPVQYWDIRPYQTKTIGKAFVVGHLLENNTVFVRVNGVLLNHKGVETKTNELIFPIPYEVTKTKGVFTTKDILDFGLLKQGVRSQPQFFSVYQYRLDGRLEFETLYVEKGDATGIYMEFASNPPIAVHPGKYPIEPGKPVNLVKVLFDASRITFETKEPKVKSFTGRIIAVSRGGNYNVTIPFRAAVFQGSLTAVGNDLAIREDVKPPYKRGIRLRNELPFAVAVWNVSLSADALPYFTVRLFDSTTVIPRGEERSVFLLKYNKKIPADFGVSFIYIETNVTRFSVQLQRYEGKIKVDLFSIEQDAFDFGLISRNDTRTVRFAIRNPNCATTTVRNLQVPNLSIFRLYFVAMLPLNSQGQQLPSISHQEWDQGNDLEIPPDQSVLFDLELRAPFDGVEHKGNIVISTDLESKVFPTVYEIGEGKISTFPDVLSFGATHPGRVVYRTIQVFNSFTEDMNVTRLSTLSNDPNVFFETLDATNPPLLRSGRLTNLGRVMYKPEAPCTEATCYLGLDLKTTDGQWFVHGLTLPANLAEVDSYLYKKQRGKFDSLVKEGKNMINTTIVIDTDKAKNIKIAATAEMVWPRLLTRNSVHFPLTALGNFTIVNLTLANPSSLPIAVQVIPLVIYPDAEAAVEFFKDHLLTPLTSNIEMNETLMFSLRDTELFTLKKDSPVPKLREELEAIVSQNVPRFTLSLLLKPHQKVRLRLGFLPTDYVLRSSLLLIRNNLTVIEPVVLYGRGARIDMKIEDIEARSKKPLLFEIRHDHLSDCNNPKRLMHKLSSTLTVRRPFSVSNTGEVPFTVVSMSINGIPCENRGFRILNCYPFRLQPNESYALEVAYTPDFLTTTNEADLQLYMHMNGSSWSFPLAATVPSDMMARCHRALPRPPFENLMYYSCVIALIFCLVCVLACAYLEGDRAITCAIREQYNRVFFDLRGEKRPSTPVNKPIDVYAYAYPSQIIPAEDASVITQFFFSIANFVVRCLHFIKKSVLSLRLDYSQRSVLKEFELSRKQYLKNMRKKKTPENTAANQANKEKVKEKKEPVKPAKAPEVPPKKTQNNNKIPSKPRPPTPPTPKATLVNKLSYTKDPLKEKEQQRKKSNASSDQEKKIQKAEQLMDGSKGPERKNEKQNNKKQNQKNRAPQQKVKPTQESHDSSETIDERFNPRTFTVPDYNELLSLHLDPPTPPGSTSDIFNNPSPSVSIDRDQLSMRSSNVVGQRIRSPSEGEMSIASEFSEAPVWMDEKFDISNVDEDFSAFGAGSDLLQTSGSETGDRGGNEDRKKKRKKKTSKERSAPIEPIESSPDPMGYPDLAETEIDPQLMQQFYSDLMGIYSEMLPANTPTNTTMPDMWSLDPGSSSWTPPETNWMDLTNFMTSPISTAPITNTTRTDPLTPAAPLPASTATTSSTPITETAYNPMTWEAPGANPFLSNTMFGSEFQVWSSSSNNAPPSSAGWGGYKRDEEDEDDHEEESK
ncbi:unnamed protein product [Auanema sp. JU1783]|nr:unnamed protein product [Auanema sp. JU1783]